MQRICAAVLLLLAAGCSEEAEPPSYSHSEPDEANGQTCVLCHTCGGDGTGTAVAPVPEQSHSGCKVCHESNPPEHCGGSCDPQKGCGESPRANCRSCHDSVAAVNDDCRDCHEHE